jgi:SAM-dependent methyltransferase
MLNSAMLNSAESEYYLDPALYDATFAERQDDIALYLKAADQVDGPILELGAGSGRVTLELVRRGHSVVAVDPSRSMLARLEARLLAEPPEVAARVSTQPADAASLALPEKFGLVLATFNVVGHLETSAELVSFLEAARRHLRPAGELIFDTLAPDEEELFAEPDDEFELDPIRHPESGAWLEARERIHYDPVARILTATTSYKNLTTGAEFNVPLRLRQWFPKEIEAALQAAGFKDFTLRGDYDEKPDLTLADMFVIRARI